MYTVKLSSMMIATFFIKKIHSCAQTLIHKQKFKESVFITCFYTIANKAVWSMFRPGQIKLSYKIQFFHVYKLTTSLVLLTKKSLYTIKYPFLYYLHTP